MTEILLQSAIAEAKGAQLKKAAEETRQKCASEHHAAKGITTLAECPECLGKILDAFADAYSPPSSSSEDEQPKPPPHDEEWFSSRHAFLRDLDALLADVRAYRADPSAVDKRIQEERSRWYAEAVRASLLPLIVEDPINREAVIDRLEDTPADAPVLSAEVIAKILDQSPLLARDPSLDGVGARLLAAGPDAAARVEVLRRAFFTGDDGATVPAEHEKFLQMAQRGMSMGQVVDRVLEDRQVAVSSQEHAANLRKTYDELSRAHAAHEAEKARKQKLRSDAAAAASARSEVPDELYDLSLCVMCGKTPSTADFLCCPICAILVSRRVQLDKPAVYCCREHDELRDQLGHATAHTCAADLDCIQPSPSPAAAASHRDDSASLVFCRECLDSLKVASLWCSPACAAANFQRHREDVHMPARRRLGLVVTDRDQFEYYSETTAGETRYRARDISRHVISFEDASRRWEEETHVRLQKAEKLKWGRS
ncbi:hypothetical protein QBC39DRAFT_387204 [Podospora conica]|nr:hypothetical protein QBC39DRAFT_387204 [Schizothecium conicum]